MQWRITEVKPFMMMLKAYFRLSSDAQEANDNWKWKQNNRKK